MKTVEKEAIPSSTAGDLLPLKTIEGILNSHCVGSVWHVQQRPKLVQSIAFVAVGQAFTARRILHELSPGSPPFIKSLQEEAKIRLTVQDDYKSGERYGYPTYQRDGFIFEVVSWVAALQNHGKEVLLKDPHTSATSQGLDGLMITLSADRSRVDLTTIFEDKCTENARETFRDKVIPGFQDRHSNKRGAELVATASTLLRMAAVDADAVAMLSASVMDRTLRSYRAAFALTSEFELIEARQKLFKGYEKIVDLDSSRRIGACFIVEGELREWFNVLAEDVRKYLDDWELEVNNV
ncbi:hypothetical protein [Pseudomonas chlororaphis]|uniref:hypothetical protein n=1 Tax=Pseudomonas chlororaphis TaxID=587753 RepID=UPI001CF54652|nr:hypothetical protein [Pseudomonas chlororaphis]UCR85088.1 hypothetical protein K9V45_02840 [Pseudomonas chlororaphis]